MSACVAALGASLFSSSSGAPSTAKVSTSPTVSRLISPTVKPSRFAASIWNSTG